MFDKAFQAVKLYGFNELDVNELYRLADYGVSDSDGFLNEDLMSICLNLYKTGTVNNNILFLRIYLTSVCLTKETIYLFPRVMENSEPISVSISSSPCFSPIAPVLMAVSYSTERLYSLVSVSARYLPPSGQSDPRLSGDGRHHRSSAGIPAQSHHR